MRRSSKKSKKKDKGLDAEGLLKLTVDRISSSRPVSTSRSVSEPELYHTKPFEEIPDDVFRYFEQYEIHSEVTNQPRHQLATDPLVIHRQAPPIHKEALRYYQSEARRVQELYEIEYNWLMRYQEEQDLKKAGKPIKGRRRSKAASDSEQYVKTKSKKKRSKSKDIDMNNPFNVFYLENYPEVNRVDQPFWWEQVENKYEQLSVDRLSQSSRLSMMNSRLTQRRPSSIQLHQISKNYSMMTTLVETCSLFESMAIF